MRSIGSYEKVLSGALKASSEFCSRQQQWQEYAVA